jgi:putative transposase
LPKLRHYDHLNTARFVTFSCYRRHQLLTKPSVIRIFLQTLQAIRQEYDIRLFGYVIMPEHVHLVLHPPDSVKLGPVIGKLKSKSAAAIITASPLALPADCLVERSGRVRRAFWQPRCYDHNCRTPETVTEKTNYCHLNPVKRRLVQEPGQWRWSSYNWYVGRTDVPIEIDPVDTVGKDSQYPT